jgi:hypothetical protein
MKIDKEKLENIKIPYKFDSRYIFNDSSNRIFKLISEVEPLKEIISGTKLPYVFSDGKSPTLFDYNLNEISSFDTYKEISWLITCNQIQTPIKINFNLTENTLDNTVLVIFEISIVKREVIPNEYKLNIINYFEGIAVDVLNNIINKLKNEDKEIYHYESKLFNYSRDKVVEVIFKLADIFTKKGDLKSITKLEEKNFEGQIINYTHENGNEIKIKIDKVEMDKDDIKWTITYMPLDISYSDYLVEWKIIKVKENQTLLIIHNIYYEQIEPSVITKLSEKKKNIFSIMEEELKKKYP